MPDFRRRSEERELMDDLSIGAEEMNRTLRELEVVNRRLGGFRTSADGIRRLIPDGVREIRLLDIGTGGGDLPRRLIPYLKGQGITARVTAVDWNPFTIDYARRQDRDTPGLEFVSRDLYDLPEDEPYDIVHAALFLHHFPGEEAQCVLRKMLALSRRGVVVNDLQRHLLAYHSIAVLTRILSRSRLIRHDAPLSVLRAFHQSELVELAQQCDVSCYDLEWRWAFRWLLVLHKAVID